jgi:outer membrane murein-binding lipoprotein Lpp
MKKTLIIIVISVLCFGCNMNPNKEARIQQLESDMQQLTEKINQLEERAEALEKINEELNLEVGKMENN